MKYYTASHEPHWLYVAVTNGKHPVFWYDPMQYTRGWYQDKWVQFIYIADKCHRTPDLALILAGIPFNE